MFDPSKLNLDLDENEKVSKAKTPEEIKTELEKVEKSLSENNLEQEERKEIIETSKQEEKDILWNVEQKFIEKDLEKQKEKKIEKAEEKKEDEEEQKEVVWDISETVAMNKMFNKAKAKENIWNKDLIDINIKSLEDILNIMNKNSADIFIFEPRDTDIKVTFREGKIEKDIKYIKFPIYNQILLRAKALTKMKIEEVNIGQEWKWEIQIKESKYAVVSKTVPSVLGEKLFMKIKKLEKKIIAKSQQKTSIGALVWFMVAIAVVALVIGWAFIGFIVMNAKTLEDVKFFYSLWINLNDINAFIWKSVNVIFSILVFIETVFLAMFWFKALLTKKIYKKKKIAYSIFAIILLLFTFTTGSAWMYINKKIANLPNWQIMAWWDVQIFDNSKLISGNFSESETILNNTTDLIWPVTLKFDISNFEYTQRKKWFNIDRYEWIFEWEKEKTKKTPTIIKTFDKVWTYKVLVNVYWTDAKWESKTKVINNIKSIEISSIVRIKEKINKLWFKTVGFDARDLENLWELEWTFIEKTDANKYIEPIHTWYEFHPQKKIFEDIMVWLYIKREWKKTTKLDKIFIIKKLDKSKIKWEIKFKQDLVEDLKYSFYVEKPDNAFWNWYVETFTWKIEWDITKKEAWEEDVEWSSRVEHKFKKYWKQNIEVELRDASGKIKILRIEINIPKKLKLKNKFRLKIFNDWNLLNDIKFEDKNHEYYINELDVPTKLKFDARLIRTDDIYYKVESVSWDLNDDWTTDKTGKVLDLDVDVEWNKTVVAHYTFKHRITKEVIIMKERIYIESIKKDAILKLKITTKNKYVPTFVRFDASLTQIKWKNIEKFIYDYDDGTAIEERDAINPAHRYNLPWEYDVKLTVITTDWSKYSLIKKLVLKPKPQKAAINVSMKTTEVNQEIDFSSEWSEGQITWYFWDFWDWEVSTDANPWHAFEIAGKYNVKLKTTFSNNNELEDEVEIEIVDY